MKKKAPNRLAVGFFLYAFSIILIRTLFERDMRA